MSDAGQESVDRLAEERKKTIVSVCVTSICIILFILDLSGLIKVDGWAFALLVIAVIPWSFSTLLSALRSFGKAFREYKYVNDEPTNHDLRYLRDHGYLEMFQLAELKPGENLVGRLKVTEMGQRFVELKEGRLTS
jgi:hypothetical protein